MAFAVFYEGKLSAVVPQTGSKYDILRWTGVSNPPPGEHPLARVSFELESTENGFTVDTHPRGTYLSRTNFQLQQRDELGPVIADFGLGVVAIPLDQKLASNMYLEFMSVRGDKS